ncbi:hypothetical protein RZS08_19850, partial [Arthrospira platensis SPKY1]|nr:hypothetical protein [Arthrospira platensis SPKY1]
MLGGQIRELGLVTDIELTPPEAVQGDRVEAVSDPVLVQKSFRDHRAIDAARSGKSESAGNVEVEFDMVARHDDPGHDIRQPLHG